MNNPSHIFITIGITAIVVEMLLGVVTGFELFVLGVILIIAGAIGMATTVTYAVISIAVLIAIYLLILRNILKNALHLDNRRTNVEAVIGKKATVTHHICPDAPGIVKVDGEEWRAEANTEIEVGREATIISVSGVTVTVV